MISLRSWLMRFASAQQEWLTPEQEVRSWMTSCGGDKKYFFHQISLSTTKHTRVLMGVLCLLFRWSKPGRIKLTQMGS